MNLTNTSRYAIRILSYMALQGEQLFSAKHLVERLKISDKYLRGLMTNLARKGLVKSVQGREGGYEISKPHSELYLIDIISAVEDISKYTGCVLGFEECSNANPCALHDQWSEIKTDTVRFLQTTTLADIVKSKHVMKF